MISMNKHINHHHFFKKPEFWGLTSVGERGQVVIPVQARKSLNIKKGDKLAVITKGEKFIGMIKADELSGFLRKWLGRIESARGKNDE